MKSERGGTGEKPGKPGQGENRGETKDEGKQGRGETKDEGKPRTRGNRGQYTQLEFLDEGKPGETGDSTLNWNF